jgi:hypothetical protein
MTSLLALGMLILGATGDTGPTVPLHALKTWTIVVAPDATPSEQYAVEEFRTLFKQAARVELSVSNEISAKTNVFRIGPGASAQAPDQFGEEELLLQIQSDSVTITGGRPRGTLYGVYEFFERYLDCEFLTYDHTWLPEAAALKTLPVEQYRYKNPFSFRWSYYKENSDHPEFATRQRINTVATDEKLGGKTPQNLINHSFYKWVNPEKFAKTHPEYFALIDGARQVTGSAGGGPQPCPSDPAVIDLVTQGVLEELAQNPGIRNVSVSQNDNGAYCQCPRCEEINQREDTPMGANLMLVNAVAERVEKTHPEVMIGTLAYWYTRKPPKTIKPRANVQIQLCSIECCSLHPLNDPACPGNRAFCADLDGWKAISDNIWIWNYNTNFSYYDLPFPNLKSIGPNVKYFLDSHAKGVFMQANGNGNAGEFCDLRNYVISKCLWKPGSDSWALAEKFCKLHYGNAADEILTWLRREYDAAQQGGFHPDCGPTAERLGLTPEVVQEALACFARAMDKADNDAIRDRVEKASISAYKAALLTAPVSWQFVDGKLNRAQTDEGKAILDKYTALCAKHHMTMHSEGVSLEKFLETFREQASVPATQIENAVWRVTVVPEHNGAAVGLLHKPSGRQMLRAMSTPDMEKGILETYVLSGSYKRTQQMNCTAEVETTDTAAKDGGAPSKITLTKKLEDGTVEQRVFRLSDDAPKKVQMSFSLTQGGTAPRPWRFNSQTGFDPGTHTKDADTLTVYAKAPEWTVMNRGWYVDDGPDAEKLQNAKGGGYAFFNHEAKFGALITFTPEEVGQLYMFWHPERPQLNMDVRTPTTTLNPGQTMQLRYTLEYLVEPPK